MVKHLLWDTFRVSKCYTLLVSNFASRNPLAVYQARLSSIQISRDSLNDTELVLMIPKHGLGREACFFYVQEITNPQKLTP